MAEDREQADLIKLILNNPIKELSRKVGNQET